jgi:3-keto-disaccharide hydrolase
MLSMNPTAAFAAIAMLFLAFGVNAARAADAAPNTLSDQEKKAGFKLLFDGKTTNGWRSFKQDKINPGWQVKDGALTRASEGAGDIVSNDPYEAFELLIDYKISPGGNSGIMFHVDESQDTPWMTGPEIQIQDNVGGHDPQKSGWLYQLYQPQTDATKPAGDWNSLRIIIAPKGQKSSVYMNGQKYYEFVKGSDDWNDKVKKSKFGQMPNFGKPTKGYISLQDHGDDVAYRNIKIRVIDPSKGATTSAK